MSRLDALVDELGRSEVFDLEHDRYVGAPTFPAHWPGFVYTLHRRHERIDGESRTSASGTLIMQEHSGTHIDALSHQAVDMQLYGGLQVDAKIQTPRGFTALGAENIPPVMRRGILLDVAASKGVERLPEDYLITDDDLDATAREVDIRPGDCLLVRTGYASIFSDERAYLNSAGIGASGARWLADQQPFLCGSDNVSFDAVHNTDPQLGTLPSHTILIVNSGIYIVENLNLEPLHDAGCTEFLFICMPMKLCGVTGSPVRPIAIRITG